MNKIKNLMIDELNKIDRGKCKECNNIITDKWRRVFCSSVCSNKNKSDRYKEYRTKWARKNREHIREKNGKPKTQCVICGGWFRVLGLHTFQIHKLTCKEYEEARKNLINK